MIRLNLSPEPAWLDLGGRRLSNVQGEDLPLSD